MYGVGGERIRQMKEGALAKLRRRFSNQLKIYYNEIRGNFTSIA